jgi:hypothetical protein
LCKFDARRRIPSINQEDRVTKQSNDKPAAPSRSATGGYGKVDTDASRDVMTEVGKSKGQNNNSGDFGNGNDGATAATGEDPIKSAVAAIPAKERAATAAAASAVRDSEKKYPA